MFNGDLANCLDCEVPPQFMQRAGR